MHLQILFLIIFNLTSKILSLGSNSLSQVNPILNFIQNFNENLYQNKKYKKIFEDAYLQNNELIKKNGYKAEKHAVQTKDGYVLGMYRIPKEGGQPILLMHGLFDSSDTWILMGPGKGLAYILSDHGYDVWMGNARGNRYSRKHVSISPNLAKFWDFSFHEIGKYDLPAMIDYVLGKTKHEKLHYVGHSQGATAFYIMGSEVPEYNNKILSMQGIGPAAYFSHMKGPLVALLPYAKQIAEYFKSINLHEFLPNSEIWTVFGQEFCRDGLATQIFCTTLLGIFIGSNPKQTNTTMIPIILGHAPAGAATNQPAHYSQIANSGIFRKFDYGKSKNLEKYNQITPPEYKLSNLKSKIALHYSLNDWLAAPKDVEKLYEQLPNPIGKFIVDDPEFTHTDFIWAIDAKKLVYDKIIKIMKSVEKGDL